MSGQLIILPGVTSAATANSPKIDITAADIAALRIQGFKHAVSARSLTNTAGGGVTGRCRKTGVALTQIGANATFFTKTTIASHPALTTVGSYAVASGALGLPAGSATASYCAVFACTIGTAALAGTTAPVSVLLSTVSEANADIAYMARYRASIASAPNGMTSAGGDTVTNTNIPISSMPAANVWGIYVVDWEDDTKVSRCAYNSSAVVSTTTGGTSHAVTSTSRINIGYSSSSSGLHDCGLGDIYFFDRSMLNNSTNQAKVDTIITALKAQYGIA